MRADKGLSAFRTLPPRFVSVASIARGGCVRPEDIGYSHTVNGMTDDLGRKGTTILHRREASRVLSAPAIAIFLIQGLSKLGRDTPQSLP
jgi:hypothetical protein